MILLGLHFQPPDLPVIYRVWNESHLLGNASLCLGSLQDAKAFSQSLINAGVFCTL